MFRNVGAPCIVWFLLHFNGELLTNGAFVYRFLSEEAIAEARRACFSCGKELSGVAILLNATPQTIEILMCNVGMKGFVESIFPLEVGTI